MTQPRILVLGDISEAAIAALSGHGELELAAQAQPTGKQLARAQIIVVRSHVRIGEALLADAPALELVVRAGAGLENVDLNALRRHDVQLCHLGGRASARSVAELAVAHVLCLLRQTGLAHRGISRGEWLKPRLMGEEIQGRRVAVWGYGSVGQCCAELFGCLAAEIRVHNRSGGTAPFASERSLAKLAQWADVHVLALPHNSETVGLLSAGLISRMASRRPIIVNMGRSGIADFGMLKAALENGSISGLGIDPLSLGDIPAAQELAARADLNTVLTPHIGATTTSALQRMGDDIVAAVAAFLADRGRPRISCENSRRARPEAASGHLPARAGESG